MIAVATNKIMETSNNSSDEGIENMEVDTDPMNELTTKMQGLEVKKKEGKVNLPTALEVAMAQFKKNMKAAHARSRRRNQQLRAMDKKQKIEMIRKRAAAMKKKTNTAKRNGKADEEKKKDEMQS